VRIACSGLVAADGGSVASAGFEILSELLARGHAIDFFSKRSYVYPEALLEHPGFRYVECGQPRVESLAANRSNEYAKWLGYQIVNTIYMRRIIQRMRELDRMRHYDLEFFVGQWAYGRVRDLPVVSWVQGAPGTDSRSVSRHREDIKRLCGRGEYARLRAYSWLRASRLGRPRFANTDVPICGSRGSGETLVARYGIAPGAPRALPYPIDLDEFRPATRPPQQRPLELVWVGRIVPRKRLDLFLDAGAALIAAGRDVRLTVVGGFPFARGFQALLAAFPNPDRLTYKTNIPRTEVRNLLQSAAVLVQPSEEEDFGSSVAEALACGTPVVVGPSNGTGDYIGTGGVRFADYRAGSVTDAIAEVLDRLDGAPHSIRTEARAAAEAHFHVDLIVDRLEAIFRDALPN
jgi:glycosyltransferase involved in cell wall biosynthesis